MAIADRNHRPLGSPCAAEIHESRVIRPGQWRIHRGRLGEPEERPDQDVARLDRQGEPTARHVCRSVLHARGEVAGAGAAGRLLRAQRRVTLDPLIDLGSAVNEVPGRVDPDHHRAVDIVRVPPLVDHRETGPGALAEQVDALVAERDASGLDVAGLLRQRVAGEVYAVSLKALARTRRRPGSTPVSDALARYVGGVLQRRRHLGTVQHRRAVDAAVADHDDIVLGGQAVRLGKRHVGNARAAVEVEDRRQRVR